MVVKNKYVYVCRTVLDFLVTRAVRHRVLKWAWFVFGIIIFVGVDFRSFVDWLARRQYVINVIWRRTKCGREKCALLA